MSGKDGSNLKIHWYRVHAGYLPCARSARMGARRRGRGENNIVQNSRVWCTGWLTTAHITGYSPLLKMFDFLLSHRCSEKVSTNPSGCEIHTNRIAVTLIIPAEFWLMMSFDCVLWTLHWIHSHTHTYTYINIYTHELCCPFSELFDASNSISACGAVASVAYPLSPVQLSVACSST